MSRWSPESDEVRFWNHVDVAREDECWLWTASRIANKYGQFWYNDKRDYAHRVSWLINRGEIPDGIEVLHKCDNMICVNPNHLFLGTQADNMQDCTSKNRELSGEKNTQHKLTIPEVRIIKKRLSAGDTQYDVAKSYPRVRREQIGRIARGENWKKVSSE